jgi:cytoskeletal protein RodZ
MSGLIRDTRDQPGLEVVPPAPGLEAVPQVYREELGYHQQETKDAAYIIELPKTSTPRICGLSTRTFWPALVLVLVVLGAAVGGGVGGGLSAAHKDQKVPTPQQQQSLSPVSPSSATSTTSLPTSSARSTSSSSSTSSAITPFSTQPGTYRIINIATNTTIDLDYGGTTNGTEIECW